MAFDHSKLNISPIASRTRGSCSFSRRRFIQKPCVPDGRLSGISSRLTQPFWIAGKLYSVAQRLEKNSSWNRYSPTFSASKAAVLSAKYW